jgi:methylenetetrahydrofolate dehydrogenase (NADP+) / methenyltetrahydrofolate cyclohydrolase
MSVTMLIENTLRSTGRALNLRQENDYQEYEAPPFKAG